MSKINFNTAFKGLSNEDIKLWIVINRHRLVGSAIFTRNKSFTSKIVQWAENWGKKNKKGFVPSHTGSIIEYKKQLWVFDMKPPKATITKLSEYIEHTQDEYAIVLRDFTLDEKMFSVNILEHLKQRYPFMSAIRSVFTKRPSRWANHCSELTLREYQKQGIMTEYNPECTPDELYHWMVDKKN